MTDARNRIVSGKAFDEDARIEASVRPASFDDYIGQDRVKENLQIAVEAARARGEALDHVLLYGPPGLGKTTLAQILANEMGSSIKISSGPLLEKKGDLTAVLTSLDPRDFFFLDEIHRLQPALEEILYPAMEDFRVDLIIGQGPGARVHPYQLHPFTLIGATTRAGLIMAPLRSRFGIVHRLEFYSPEDLLRIVQRSAKILGITTDEAGASEIARRSRGTPRVANRLLRRVRDYAEVRAKGHITLGVARDALAMLGRRRAWARRSGPQPAAHDHPEICRRPGGSEHDRRVAQRRRRRHRGNLRTLPDAAGPAGSHPARPRGHRAGLQAFRDGGASQANRPFRLVGRLSGTAGRYNRSP